MYLYIPSEKKTVDPYGHAYIKGFYIDLYGIENGILYYTVNEGKTRTASEQLARWAKGLHGNPPSGTLYRRFIVTLPNKKRVSINDYI